MQTHHGKFSHLFIALAARFQEHNPMRRQCQFTVKRSPKCAVVSVTTSTTSWSKYDKSNNDYNTNKAEDRK